MPRPRSTTRWGLAALAALALVGGSTRAAAAAAQVADPVITVTATYGSAFVTDDCKGVGRATNVVPIVVTLTRAGDTTPAVTVGLRYGGSLAQRSGLPATATIEAGATSVALTANDASGGDLNVTVLAGTGYVVGNPSTAFTGVGVGIGDLGCNIGNVHTEQTIEVGTTPTDIDVVKLAYGPPDNLARSIEGTVPPGLTFHLDGTWEGTATTAGDYGFDEYFCEDDGWCPYRASIRIIVLEGDAPPADPGPPRPPATAPAATPVTGAPQLTG